MCWPRPIRPPRPDDGAGQRPERFHELPDWRALPDPLSNRIRGKLSADGQTVTTEWEGHTLALPAIGGSRQPVPSAVRSTGSSSKPGPTMCRSNPFRRTAGDRRHSCRRLWRHWLSKTDLFFAFTLTGDAARLDRGGPQRRWRSGTYRHRLAPRLHSAFRGSQPRRACISRLDVAEVDNYDNVFPTGKIKPVAGTQYDLRAPGGVALGKNSYDDNWSKLEWKNGQVTVQ